MHSDSYKINYKEIKMTTSKKIIGYTALGAYTRHGGDYWRNRFGRGDCPFGKYRVPYGFDVYFLQEEVDAWLRLELPDWQGPPLSMELATLIESLESAVGHAGEALDDKRATERLLGIPSENDATHIYDLTNALVIKSIALANLAGVALDMAHRAKRPRELSRYLNARRGGGLDATLEDRAADFVHHQGRVAAMALYDFCNGRGECMEDVFAEQLDGKRAPFTK